MSHIQKTLLQRVSEASATKLSKKSLSVENFDQPSEQLEDELNEISDDVVQNAQEPLKQIVGVERFEANVNKYTEVAKRAVKSAISSVKNVGKQSKSFPQGKGDTLVLGVESYDLSSSSQFNLSKEYYDPQNNNSALTNAISYALMGLGSDFTTSTIFPTYMVDSATSHIRVEVNTPFIITQGERNGSGQLVERKETPISHMYYDTRNFNNNSTDIHAIFRDPTTYPTNSNASLIGAAKQSIIVYTNGVKETIDVAPIKVGTTIDILNLSQTPSAMALGLSDVTDAIDRGASITSLILTNVDNDLVKVDVPFSRNRFNSSNGSTPNEKQMVINYNDVKFGIKDDFKYVFDTVTKTYTAALTQSAVLTGKYVVFTFKINGSLDLSKGEIDVDSKVISYKLFGAADHIEVEPSVAEKAYLGSFVVAGYIPALKRTNSNMKEFGSMVETKMSATIHPIEYTAPVHTKDPIIGADDNVKIAKMQALQAVETIQKRKACFDALEAGKQILEQISYIGTQSYYEDSLPYFSQASKLFKPTFIEESVDVETTLNSIQSSNKERDIAGLIVSQVRNIVARLYTESRYSAGIQQLGINASNKPHILIVTDPEIGRFLISEGDTRLVGPNYTHTVVADIDPRFKDKLYILFTSESAVSGGVVTEYDNLAFGTLACSSSLLGQAVITTRGGVSNVTISQPRFNPIINIPVMGSLIVTGISDAIGAKTIIENHPN